MAPLGKPITEETRKLILRLLRLGCTYRDVAWEADVSVMTVARVANAEKDRLTKEKV